MKRHLAWSHSLSGRLGGNYVDKVFNIYEHALTAASYRVDQLVASDREKPGPKRRVGVPSVSLQMQRQENLLYYVLELVRRLTGARQFSLRSYPKNGRNLPQ
jgi:hypothetical protein